MAGILTRTKQALTVLRKGLGDDLGFATGANDLSAGAGFPRSNMRLWLSGTHVDYARIAGPLWANSAFAACMLWFARNFLQAPPVVKRREGKSEIIVEDHPLPKLLARPNPYYGWDVLASGIALSWWSDGNDYLFVDRDRLGRPTALWYCPHWLLEPRRRKGSKLYKTHYEYMGKPGSRDEIPLERVVQLQNGIDPSSPLKGFNPGGPILREVATDIMATNFSAATMKNRGFVGAVASPKDPNFRFDTEEFVEKWRAKTTGDNAGDILALDVPIDMQFPDLTPDKMALDKIRQYPEARIASIFGLPAQVVGFIVSEMSKTYANYSESREAAWEESLLPNGGMILRQLGAALMPDMDGYDERDWLGMDISNIRPLQPDKDLLHKRVREDYKAGMIDRYTALTETGREPTSEDIGVYFTAGGAALDEKDDKEDKDEKE